MLEWNDKESNGARIAISLLPIYSDKTASKMNCGVFVIYPVYAVLLNFSAALRQMFISYEHILLRLLLLSE